MKRLIPLFLLVLTSTGFEPKTVVEPQTRFTKHVLFVIDTSGSMGGNGRIHRAIDAFLTISQQTVDEAEFGVIAFSGSFARWPGIPEGDVPEGWAALPSEEAVQEAQNFVEQDYGIGGDTRVLPPLRAAFEDDREELTIVLITDGWLHREYPDEIVGTVENLLDERREAGNPVVFACIGVAGETSTLSRLGEIGKGGFYLVPDPPSPPGIPHYWNPVVPQPPKDQ